MSASAICPRTGRGDAYLAVVLQQRVPLAADPGGFRDLLLRDGLSRAERQAQERTERRALRTDARAAPLEKPAEPLLLVHFGAPKPPHQTAFQHARHPLLTNIPQQRRAIS
jgi:hypothetical protein